MKKQLSFLMLLAALVVPWASKAQGTVISSFPWTCGFENATENAAWTFVNGSNAWCIGTAAQNGGSNGLYVSNDNGTTNSYSGSACVSYAYVQFVVSAPGQYALQFDWKCNGEGNYDFLRVAVSDTNTALPTSYSSWTTTTVPTGFMAVDGGSKLNLQGTQWQQQTSIITVTAAGAYRLVFVWRNDGTVFNAPPAAVDNVSVTEVTCPSPVIEIDNLLSEEVELSWYDAGATSWMYRVNNSAWTTITDNSLYIDTLSPQTTYTVSVRAYCGGTDTSLMSTVSFTTPCAAIEGWTLPWTYGFEDATGTTATATFNSCLGRFREGTTTNYPYPSSTNHTGTKSLYMYSSSSAYSWLVLPLFDEDLSMLMLSFYAYRATSTSYGHWTVGVMSNPSDISTFEPIATGQVSANSTWELVEVPLIGYEGEGTFLAILCPSMSAACSTYIDDITVDFMPDCMRPVGLTVSDITATSATLTINDPTDVGDYMLYINGDSIEVSGDTYDLTDLQPATTYQLTVKSICGDGSMTNPISTSFATPCEAITNFPWAQDFDILTNINDLNCWDRYTGLYNDTADFTLTPTTSGWLLHSAHGMDGSQHVKVNIYGTSCKYWIMTPEFSISSGMELSFDYSLTTWNSDNPIDGPVDDDRFVVFAVIGGTEFVPLAKWGSDSVRDDYSYAAISTTPSSISFPLDQFDGEVVRFAFYGESTASGDDNDMHVDNVFVGQAAACAKPAAAWVDEVSSEEVSISWYDPTWVGSYVVEYYPEGSNEESESVSVSDTTVILTGLIPNTVYMANIMSYCGELSVPRTITFRTACVPLVELPWFEDFEDSPAGSATSSDFVPCMTRINNGTTYFGYPYVSSSSGYNHTPNGSKGLYWYGSTTTGTYGDYQYAVLPPVDTDMIDFRTMQVRFWARATTSTYNVVFQVGVMTNPADVETFQLVQTINVGGNTEYTEYTVPFGLYEGYGQYVAIRALRPVATWYATMDDITLEEMPNCPPVVGLTATPSVNGALLTWNYQEGFEAPDSYNVTYHNMEPGYSENDFSVSTPSAILTGLEDGSTYIVYVQADCGDDLGRADSVVFTTGSFACAQLDPATVDTVSVGNGTTTVNYMPVGNFYKYSYTQQIILASEMNGATTITGISFEYGYSTPTTSKNNVDIYMANVSDTSVASGFVEYNANTFQLVYSGDLNCTEGWNIFELDNPFSYNGTSNLLIVVHDNSNAYDGSAYVFKTHSSSGKARYVQNDSNPYVLGSVTATLGSSTNRANLKLYSGNCQTVSICAAPVVGVDEVTENSVTVVWAPGASETSWDIDYRPLGSASWISVATGETGNSYTIDELNDGTNYEFRVSYTCSDNISGLMEGIITAATLCQVKSLPYVEDFEGATGNVPNCWDYMMTGTSTYQTATYQPIIYTNTATASFANGNKCLKLYGVGLYSLPEVEAPLDSLRLTFTDTITAATSGLIVGVMEDGLFVPVDTAALENGVRNYIEVFFENYQGDSRIIAFCNYYTTSTSTYTSTHYIDDVVVDYIPVCSHVNGIEVAENNTNSIELQWTAGGEESQWLVTGSNGYTAIVNDNSATINGLTANTPYTFAVRAICTEGDTSEAMSINVRTACDLLTEMPFVEDFESQTVGSSNTASDFIPCWTRLNNGTTYGGYPYVNNASGYNHTQGGTKGLYFYGSTTSTTYGDYQYAVLPQINVDSLPLNNLRLSFWARSSSTSYTPVLEVGVMEDANDTSFTLVKTIQFGGDIEWREFYADFDNYDGDGSFVAIRGLRPSSTWGAYVDDIMLDFVPACPRVEDLAATDMLLTSATVYWSDTSDNSGWNVEYDTVAFAPGTGHMTAIHVTDTFCVLSGLDSATTYHVYVYPDCNGDVYYRHTVFNTLAASPASVPYFCNFEATGPNGWDFVNEGQVNHWMVGGDTSLTSRALYVTNDDINNAYTVGSASYAFAVRVFNLTDTGEYVCTYDWKANGESSYDFLRAALVPANVQLEAGDYCGFDNTSAVPAGGIALDGGSRLNLQTEWQNQVAEFQITTPGLYKIVFLWRNDPSVGNQPPAAIDNVELKMNACPVVSSVVSDISSTSISLTWAAGNGTAWLVTFDGTTTTVTTPAYTATGLTAQTDHTVAIRAICGVGDTSFAFTDTYHTPCVAVSLPYSENFDGVTTSTTSATGEMPDCWNYIMTGTATYQTGSYLPQVYYGSTYANSGNYSLRLYGVGYHMLPPMPVSLDSLQLTFSHYYTSSSYGLEVGVMEGNTFIPIQTINNPTSTHSNNTVYFGTYTGNSRIIAFHNYYTTSTTTYYTYNYIDDVVVDYLPNCPPVLDIVATEASTTTLTVDWTDQIASNQWQVRYGPMGSTNTTTVVVSSHPTVITGLDTLTTYGFQVRPICSSTDTGDWSMVYYLSTEMCNGAYVVTTGNPTGTTYNTPVNNFYKYTLTETIIDSAELAGVGEINAIAYSYSYGTPMTDKTDVTIWLQPTNKTVFSSNSDVVALDTNIAVQVYQGDLNCMQGWNYFALDVPFVWNGHSNLLVIVDDNSNDYNSSSYVFNSSACNGYKTIHYYSDSQNPDPTNPTTFTGNKAYYEYRATMKLVSCGLAPCEIPSVDSVSADETTAYVSFSGNSSNYELAIVEGAWDESMVDGLTTYTTAASHYTFTGLDDGVLYTIAIRGVCGPDRISDWTAVSVTTLHHPCFVPTEVTVAENTYDGATVSWQPGEEETAWEVTVFCASPVYEHVYTVEDTPNLVVTGLDNGVTYNVTVRAMCDENWYSEWSDTVDLTTAICPQVTDVNATDITASSAIINWTATDAESYEVEYGYAGFQQGNGTSLTATTNRVEITGLEEVTSYDVYVRGVCAEGVTSLWSAKYNFTTDETPVEGIDDVENGNVTLFPNPASTTVTIRGIEGESIVTVVDLNGREVFTSTANNSLTIDVTGFAKGAYFVRITGERTTAIRKLIVK